MAAVTVKQFVSVQLVDNSYRRWQLSLWSSQGYLPFSWHCTVLRQ